MSTVRRVARVAAVLFCWAVLVRPAAAAFAPEQGQNRDLPDLTQPVNDFAHIVDAESTREIDHVIRTLKAASGDVIVVATVPTIEPYADINEYAVKLFENHGRGIGDTGKDNGVLIVLALKERRVRVEVGYDLEQFVTDGFAGETSREFMAPQFRREQYGPGLLAGTERIAARIAQGRGVTLEGVRVPRAVARRPTGSGLPLWAIVLIFVIFWLLSRSGRGPRARYWGGGGWSGWSSGVGPFGGGGGGWSSGGGFGGGFGGFGGGRSGGGGGGAGW